MSLELNDLLFSNFRNYESLKLDGLGSLTIFIGPNGSGKTNILEGINLITAAESFRHPMIRQLIKEGSEHSSIYARSTGDGRVLDAELHMEEGKRRFLINGKAKTTADVKGVFPSVSFVPDDLELAKKSSSVKRDALDDLGCQLSKNYYMVRRDYQKTLRYKNRLLKEEAAPLLVDSIDETLVTCAAQLCFYRYELFKRMVSAVSNTYMSISPSEEEFSSRYIPSWAHLGMRESLIDGNAMDGLSRDDIREKISCCLDSMKAEERLRARALVGPHADKIEFFLSGREVSDFASQGQQRSIVLAWKLGEVEIVRQSLGTYPVLLLDDVMSELDSMRRGLLIDMVRRDVQTFITATDLSYFPDDIIEKARVIELPLNA